MRPIIIYQLGNFITWFAIDDYCVETNYDYSYPVLISDDVQKNEQDESEKQITTPSLVNSDSATYHVGRA